ncbi:MAG: universal stress protein, partial [Actinobacteria bacterium]|nr:universal stress protein [Actinomycetota bacterium]
MFRSIVVGTDGSPTAAEAVRRATELATICGAKLHVVSAYKPLEALYVSPEVLADAGTYDLVNPEADAQRAAAEAAAGARAAGLQVSTYACPGDAAAAIIDVAEAEGADLIVVGNRGMTGRGRFL